MNRVWAVLSILASILCTVPLRAEAQSLPGRGDVLELRSDDSRCPEGHRCFLFGLYRPGVSMVETALEIVNADIRDDSRRITLEQFDASNQCLVTYTRRDGQRQRAGRCSENPTRDRVTYASFCGGSRCDRWIFGSTAVRQIVYRVPAERRILPVEQAEGIREEAESAESPTLTQVSSWLSTLRDLKNAENQPITQEQADDVTDVVIAAVSRGASVAEDRDDASSQETLAEALAAIDPEQGRVSAEEESSGSEDEGLNDSQEAGARPTWLLPLLIITIGLLLVALVLLAMRTSQLRKQNKALPQSSQSHAEALRPVADAREHKEHHAPFEEWTLSVMRNRRPTVELINEMAEVHWMLQDLERDSKTWSPAYGSIRDNNNLGRVLREVAETRSIRAVIEKEFPGTPFAPEAYAELFQAQRSKTGSGVVYVEDTKKVAKLEAEVAEMSKALEAMRKGDAERIRELEDELEKARESRNNGHGSEMLDRARVNEVLASTQAHFGDVQSHFEPHLLSNGQVQVIGLKGHQVTALFAGIHESLFSLGADIDSLSTLLAPRTLPYATADAEMHRSGNGAGSRRQRSAFTETIAPPKRGQD